MDGAGSMTTDGAILARRFLEAHPADAAVVLQRLEPEEAAATLDRLPTQLAAMVADRMTPSSVAPGLSKLPVDRAARVVAAMRHDVAPATLRWLDDDRRRALLDAMPGDSAHRLRRLLTFSEDTAGALMDPRVPSIPPGVTAGDAVTALRRLGEPLHAYVYVVDSAHRLAGVVAVHELLRAPQSRTVATLMTRNVVTLSVDDTVDAIRAHPGWTDLHALPVVDGAGTLVGVIPYRTYTRLEHQQADGSPVEAAVHTLASFGLLWWETLAAMVDDLNGVWSKSPSASASVERPDTVASSPAHPREDGHDRRI